ncbi:MAG TPA: glycosyltransferase 87 family protein [Streptosporangiaceae bacterium]|nr:glycosyltransferase 87 family protein [Streptosporangiaceae bacterium]
MKGASEGSRLLVAGLIAFAAAGASYLVYLAIHPLSWTLHAVDLHVYVVGGLIVRHVRPFYHPRFAAPLYAWTDPGLGLKFTYPPFAAVVFAAVSLIPGGTPVIPGAPLAWVSLASDFALLLVALWFTFGGLGCREPRTRAGAALLAGAAAVWTEPFLRTIYLGQVNVALMALIMWDLTQPDTRESRWWKGAGLGIAAGIKLVPLIFIPYLLLSRRFRQAATAAAAFAATVAVGFIFLPADSSQWWLHGLFAQGGRTGFVGWEGNQSLRGIITRLAGSVAAAQPLWLLVALLTAALGLSCAAVLARAGHQVAGILTCALTGLLVSPVSWDHHWVWIAPGMATAAFYAVRAMRAGPPAPWWRAAARWPAAGFWALAGGLLALFGAWPGSLWGEPDDLGHFSLGLIWAPPNTNPVTYFALGDRPWFYEYHWHGLQLLTGNSYVLGGVVLLAIMLAIAVRLLPGWEPAATIGQSTREKRPVG